MIDHDAHRIAPLGQICDRGTQQRLWACPAHARQYDEAGVDVLRGGKRAEIASVFRHENKVVFHTPGQNFAVRRA